MICCDKCQTKQKATHLQKAENYIHRAMTGQWIDRSFLNGSGKG